MRKITVMFLLLASSGVNAEIIFETDFSSDEGYLISASETYDKNNVPQGWDAVKATGSGRIEVINEPTVSDKPVLKLSWAPRTESERPVTTLAKHLTGDINAGYDELYIRYNVRLPAQFKAYAGAADGYWNWGKLLQNTAVAEPVPGAAGGWASNRMDAYYVDWNWAGSGDQTSSYAYWGTNTFLSGFLKVRAGIQEYLVNYSLAGAVAETQPGYFQSIGASAWDFYSAGENPAEAGLLKDQSQAWHTIEYRFKLASAVGADDGVFEVWVDGAKQVNPGNPIKVYRGLAHIEDIPSNGQGWTNIIASGGTPDKHGIPTARHGSGFNFFTLFGDMRRWNSGWDQPGVDGFIYVNDVVISDQRIGHDYVIGRPRPAPPTGLQISRSLFPQSAD